MNKSEIFDEKLQELARFARAISHPTRLTILRYRAETSTIISSDISQTLPLSRTPASPHLRTTTKLGLTHGESDELWIKYCLCSENIHKYLDEFDSFFDNVRSISVNCEV